VIGLLKGVPMQRVRVVVGGLGTVHMPAVAVALVVVSFVLAGTFALLAALSAPRHVATIVLALYSAVVLNEAGLGRDPSASHLVPLAVVLVAVWLCVLVERRSARVAAVAGLAVTAQLIALWSATRAPAAGVFSLGVVDVALAGVAVATVRLSYSGATFADMADAVTAPAVVKLRRVKARRWRRALAIGALLVVLGYAVGRASSPVAFTESCALLLMAGASLAALIRRHARRNAWPPRLPAGVGVATGLSVAAVLCISVALASGATRAPAPAPGPQPLLRFSCRQEVLRPWCVPTAIYRDTRRPEFSIAYPPGWAVGRLPAGVLLSNGSRLPLDVVVTHYGASPVGASPSAAGQAQLFAQLDHRLLGDMFRVSRIDRDGSIEFAQGADGATRGLALLKRASGNVWLVQAFAPAPAWPSDLQLAGAIVHSWRSDRSARPVAVLGTGASTDSMAAAHEQSRRAAGYFAALALLIAAAVGVGLALVRRCTRSGPLIVSVLSAMLFAGLSNLNYLVALIGGGSGEGVPHLTFSATAATVAALAIGLSLARVARVRLPPALRRVPAFVLVRLALATALLSLAFDRYASAADGTLSVLQVSFLLAALIWDALLCGDVVNVDGHHLPRVSRALLQCAYLLAVAASVVSYSYFAAFGGQTLQEAVSPETETAFSIAFVGVAYLVTLLTVRAVSAAGLGPASLRDRS
jgi:hypothetical protein